MLDRPVTDEAGKSQFGSVEKVSTAIFDRLVEIERPEDLNETQAIVAKSRMQKLGQFLIDAAPSFGTSEQATAAARDIPFDFAILVEGADEGSYFGLSKKAEDQPDLTPSSDCKPFVQRQLDRAIARNAIFPPHLPEGIQILEGSSENYSDDQILSAINVVMVAQKRENSRKILPEIEPAIAAAVTEPKDATVPVERIRPSMFQSMHRAVARFFMKDTVLAISLSIWGALFLMCYIDTSAVVPLFVCSLILLFSFLVIVSSGEFIGALFRRRRRTSD